MRLISISTCFALCALTIAACTAEGKASFNGSSTSSTGGDGNDLDSSMAGQTTTRDGDAQPPVRVPDANPDAELSEAGPVVTVPEAGACEFPQGWYYNQVGCERLPKCTGPEFDACAEAACSCDGETMGGCGWFPKPIAHMGPCTDSGNNLPVADASSDAG
jgi:hypothetical protein